MNENKNKRLISGNRVICQCSMDLPKQDPFDNFKISRKGYIVFNTRGGSLYLTQQFTVETVTKVFKANESAVIKKFTLYPEGDSKIVLGNMAARFLKFTDAKVHKGMVLRFVNLTEKQMDTLNVLTEKLPAIADNEEDYIRHAMA